MDRENEPLKLRQLKMLDLIKNDHETKEKIVFRSTRKKKSLMIS